MCVCVCVCVCEVGGARSRDRIVARGIHERLALILTSILWKEEP